MFSSILTGGLNGMEAYLLRAEVDISHGLPGFCMVGSLSNEVREAKERIQVALKNAGFDLPPNKITVNLAPAHIRKDGTGYDVPIAVGMLQSLGYFDEKATDGILFTGELGLNGEIKPVHGILPIVRVAAEQGIKCCIVPKENAIEGSVIPGIKVKGVESIVQLVQFLQEESDDEKERILETYQCTLNQIRRSQSESEHADFAEVRGQEMAKRAAEIAAAGFHNLLMSGPPGGGKSMIAQRIPGILPELTDRECLEVSSIYSVAGLLDAEVPLITKRPFQSPHHTISNAALVGGGVRIHPGAISLSHRGVLFLDELTEFPRHILECLRQPLEDHKVSIARANGNFQYPANFMLVCAMNPCKCGYYPDKNRCTCSEKDMIQYWNRLSGPLLDRVDMYVETSRVDLLKLQGNGKEENTATIRKRVEQARSIQEKRFRKKNYTFNSEMKASDMDEFCNLGKAEKQLMELAYTNLKLSARTYHRVLKVSRTIADLDGSERIHEKHISEALLYRLTERNHGNNG
ncbi:MAG: YifB family Mg chelatase-like AAA ATPase [Lachnospiraceae bacterium]|nr:YifB family Mg chelatase-like AAA ATPase [Lachnospiraceae bacterium]